MDMDELKRRIARAVEAGKVEFKELSAAIGRNHAYVHQFVNRGVPQELREKDVRIIVEILDQRENGHRLVGSFDPDGPSGPDFDPEWETEHSAALVDGKIKFNGKIPGSQPEIPAKPGMGEGQVDDLREARIVSNGIVTGHPVVNEWMIPHTYIRHTLDARPSGVVVMPVIGHSMEPLLAANDRVLVDTSQNTWIGDAVYVIDDGDTVFQVKTLRKIPSSFPPRFEIVSEATPDKVFERGADEFRIVGRVVGRFTRM